MGVRRAGGFACPLAVFEKIEKRTNTERYKKIKGYAFSRELSQAGKIVLKKI